MNIKLDKLPVLMEAPGMKMSMQDGLGGMAVAYWETGPMPATPNLLEGMPLLAQLPGLLWSSMFERSTSKT